MSVFTLKTEYARVVTVSKALKEGDVHLTVRRVSDLGNVKSLLSRLSPEQAVQIAHALLNVAEGKEADADRADDSAVKLLEQRMSVLEGEVQAEASRSAATIAQVAAQITGFYSGVTTTVQEPEQKFYLKLTDDKYINWDTDTNEGSIYIADNVQMVGYQTQFTQAEIDSNPELKKFDSFKIPVPDGVVISE